MLLFWRIFLLTFNCLVIFVSECISEKWEDIGIICPNQCVCQYEPFLDLSIARWILGAPKVIPNETEESEITDNESFLDSHVQTGNPYVKSVTCIIQAETDTRSLLGSLPQDLHALILLSSGSTEKIIIHTEDLSTLSELTTLEIRGSRDKNITLLIDKSLPGLLYANFESIQLEANEKTTRRSDAVDPSENFNYVPESERVEYNISLEIEEEVEILPYEVYMMEQQRSQIASFYGWESLEILRMHNCEMDELHWEVFDGLGKLQHLSLEHNDIKIIPAFAFYGTPNLLTLSLAHNKILNMNYRDLAGLLHLKTLDLSYNSLTKLSELTFPPFPELNTVDIRENPIKYIFESTFGVMNTSKEIFLGTHTTPIDLSTGSVFDNLPLLTSLTILNASVESLTQGIFKDLPSLTSLKVHGNLTKIEFDAFSGMSKVEEVILNRCSIREISMDAFYGIDSIQIIDLSKNLISFLPPNLFSQQKNLREIYLNDNHLSKLPQLFFDNIPAKVIRLTDNPWICNCDMTSWKQGVTNKFRRPGKVQKCSAEAVKYGLLPCRPLEGTYSYGYDNKLSPRCDGGPDHVKHRTVYYALRRDLKCPRKRSIPEKKTIIHGKVLSPKENEYHIMLKRLDNKPVEDTREQDRLLKMKKERQRMQKLKFSRNIVVEPKKKHYYNTNRMSNDIL
ncbi:leucine-rich repeats and immunoglobulin-like domains protein 3 [Phlebotomus papatasi]|uniref:leucine-rich repeats and immunoglobulin-like domains protein 3 n=1 Tax=Phlebotomus papatasi TaxID=29031 RepID=UPI0024835DA4|nr:leucine-rich repeats and immunoglobulin-like domains protein 3 [Phlebotomus papatasi]